MVIVFEEYIVSTGRYIHQNLQFCQYANIPEFCMIKNIPKAGVEDHLTQINCKIRN